MFKKIISIHPIPRFCLARNAVPIVFFYINIFQNI